MDKITLSAEKRLFEGRKVNQLRKKGIIPANIFGRDVKSTSIQVGLKDFEKIFNKAGETNIVEININKEVRPVLVHNVQINPVTDEVLHVDFLQVDLKKKVSAEVPIEITGESPAEKQSLGTVVRYIDKIEVKALPAEIPDSFVVDISGMSEVDQMIQVKDLKVDVSKVEVETEPDSIIVKVEPPKEEKEELPKPSETEGVVNEGETSTQDDSTKQDNPQEETKE
jgi:large subunit ribosomal protein L25